MKDAGNGRRILVIVLLALVTAGTYYRLAFGPCPPGLDFHAFWGAGHFVWQGVEPYGASLEKKEPELPDRYLGGRPPPGSRVKQFPLIGLPGTTAPMLLLISVLSLFSWPAAFSLWAAVNISAIAATVVLLCRIMGGRLISTPGLLLLFTALVIVPSRQTVQVGQTSLVVTFFMILSLSFSMEEDRAKKLWAGLALGMALSKPLLAFPLALLFLARKEFLILLVAFLVQVSGILVISLAAHTSPYEVMMAYIRVFRILSNPEVEGGMTLTAGILKGFAPYSYMLIGAGTAVLFAATVRWWRARSTLAKRDIILQVCFLNVILFWNLLVFYHRRYDYVNGLPLFALAAFMGGTIGDSRWPGRRGRAIVRAGACAIAIFWTLPFYRVLGNNGYQALFCISTLAALSLSVWLLAAAPGPLTGGAVGGKR